MDSTEQEQIRFQLQNNNVSKQNFFYSFIIFILFSFINPFLSNSSVQHFSFSIYQFFLARTQSTSKFVGNHKVCTIFSLLSSEWMLWIFYSLKISGSRPQSNLSHKLLLMQFNNSYRCNSISVTNLCISLTSRALWNFSVQNYPEYVVFRPVKLLKLCYISGKKISTPYCKRICISLSKYPFQIYFCIGRNKNFFKLAFGLTYLRFWIRFLINMYIDVFGILLVMQCHSL